MGLKCNAHCPSCGAHFETDKAFDLHRSGTYKSGQRRCRNLQKHAGLKIVTEEGTCTLLGKRESPVTIWREVDDE